MIYTHDIRATRQWCIEDVCQFFRSSRLDSTHFHWSECVHIPIAFVLQFNLTSGKNAIVSHPSTIELTSVSAEQLVCSPREIHSRILLFAVPKRMTHVCALNGYRAVRNKVKPVCTSPIWRLVEPFLSFFFWYSYCWMLTFLISPHSRA